MGDRACLVASFFSAVLHQRLRLCGVRSLVKCSLSAMMMFGSRSFVRSGG
jgi:hypothetical protein